MVRDVALGLTLPLNPQYYVSEQLRHPRSLAGAFAVQIMSRLVTKPTKRVCAQRRLRSAWASAQSDQSSLSNQWVAKDPSFLHADSEDSEQTGRMPRLIWVFAGCTTTLLVLSWGSSYVVSTLFTWAEHNTWHLLSPILLVGYYPCPLWACKPGETEPSCLLDRAASTCIMHLSFVTPAPPLPTYGDRQGIAGLMCGAMTFWLPPQHRVSAGLVILRKYTLWNLLLYRAGLWLSAGPCSTGLLSGLWWCDGSKVVVPAIPCRWGGGGGVQWLQVTGA